MRIGFLAAVVLVVGCGRISFDPLVGSGGGGGGAGDGGGDDGAVDDGPTVDGFPLDGVTGVGTINGQGCSMQAFTTVGAAYSLGHIENSGTAEIIVLSQAVSCLQLCATAWDSTFPLPCQTSQSLPRVPAGVQFLRLTLGFTGVGTYGVGPFDPPIVLQAYTRHYQVPPNGNPVQCDGVMGTVGITQVSGGALSGNFNFTLMSSTSLAGTFAADACPTGWYP